jgi:hypothetical protein
MDQLKPVSSPASEKALRHGARQGARRDHGMGSRLLTTMAIVRSNADEGRDYIANFEPFATDRLKAWRAGEPVEPDTLAQAICSEWGVPSLPTAVGKILLRRAEERGDVVRIDGRYYPDAQKLAGARDLAAQKNAMLTRMSALAKAVVGYAKAIHGLDWTEEHATEALDRLSEEFGADLAVAKRSGALAAVELPEREALAVVHGFARRAIESDPDSFEHLVEMVQGTMLVNALYFQDVGHPSNKLKHLRVFLDTTPVLRALGLAADPVCEATLELIALLRNEFQVKMFVFSHTLDEITGVLDAVAAARRRGRNAAAQQGPFGGRNREAIDAVIKKGWTAGEIDAMVAEIETRLAELGIGIKDTPPHVEKDQIDEQRFEAVLDETVGYRSKGPREKDVSSLAAIDRLRGASRPRDLSQANSLFVTANGSLVRASRAFFREADRHARVPHAMHETALTAQLWVRLPHPPPDLPRKLLIADCYAALNPGPELWERWVAHIVRLQGQGEVTDEQVQNLIYHEQAKSKLFEVTHGDPDAVGDETVTEVLDRFESELRRPAEEEVAAERARREAAELDAQRLRTEVARLTAWRTQEEASRRKRRALIRTMTGITAAVVVVVAFLLFAVIRHDVHGRWGWASAVTLLVFGASVGVTWAARLDWRSPLRALVYLGAITALFFGIYGVVPSDGQNQANVPVTDDK